MMLYSIWGDVNGDGKITADDLMLIRLQILGEIQLPQGETERADVNQDGEVNISDLLKIRNHLNGSAILGGLMQDIT